MNSTRCILLAACLMTVAASHALRAFQQPPAAPQRLPAGDPEKPAFDLRLMHPGEKRALGDLERVECLTNGTVRVHVKAAGQMLIGTARKIQAIVLQTFRGETEFSLGCGTRRPADRVYFTWRPPVTPAAPASAPAPARGAAPPARGTPATPARGATARSTTPPPAPTVVGEAVALEFLPAGYSP